MAQPNYFSPDILSFQDEPITIRKPQPRRALKICLQETASIVVFPQRKREERVGQQNERVNKKADDTSGKSSKIGKGTLRKCYTEVTGCLSHLIQSLTLVSLQLIKLHSSSLHQASLNLLHHKTIRSAANSIQNLSVQSGELSHDFLSLTFASKEVSDLLEVFIKQFPIEKCKQKFPEHWQLFKISKQKKR